MLEYEKLKQLEGWGYDFKNVKITFKDGSSMVCKPKHWDYEEDGRLTYTVELVVPYGKYPVGAYYPIEETDIKAQQIVQ